MCLESTQHTSWYLRKSNKLISLAEPPDAPVPAGGGPAVREPQSRSHQEVRDAQTDLGRRRAVSTPQGHVRTGGEQTVGGHPAALHLLRHQLANQSSFKQNIRILIIFKNTP